MQDSCVGGLLSLVGCATPQVAMDQANNGVALITQLEQEMREFRRIRTSLDQARTDAIARDSANIADLNVIGSMYPRTLSAAGDSTSLELTEKLTGLTDSFAADDEAASAVAGKSDAQLKALLKPLPSTTEKTTAAQQALASMGTELSASQRLAEVEAFYATVAEAVKKNKEKPTADGDTAATSSP